MKFWDAVLLADTLVGTACPFCRQAWVSPEDVYRRKPIIFQEEGICSDCYLAQEGITQDELALEHVYQCAESGMDPEFLANAAILLEDGERLSEAQCDQLFDLYQDLHGEGHVKADGNG